MESGALVFGIAFVLTGTGPTSGGGFLTPTSFPEGCCCCCAFGASTFGGCFGAGSGVRGVPSALTAEGIGTLGGTAAALATAGALDGLESGADPSGSLAESGGDLGAGDFGADPSGSLTEFPGGGSASGEDNIDKG